MSNISKELARNVVLFPEDPNIYGLELTHLIKFALLTPMLYHYATAVVLIVDM